MPEQSSKLWSYIRLWGTVVLLLIMVIGGGVLIVTSGDADPGRAPSSQNRPTPSAPVPATPRNNPFDTR
jgi:hypothetical protein